MVVRSALSPTPGWMHGVHLGAGVKLSKVQLDVGGAYLLVSNDVPAQPGTTVLPGEYKMNAFLASASATYAF